MSVLDSSAAIDYLLGLEAAEGVESMLATEGEAAAPDLLVYEVLATLRRHVQRGALNPGRAAQALVDLGDLHVRVFPTLPFRARAWAMRENLSAADALFAALAEALDEPLLTKDRGFARAAREHVGIEVIVLG